MSIARKVDLNFVVHLPLEFAFRRHQIMKISPLAQRRGPRLRWPHSRDSRAAVLEAVLLPLSENLTYLLLLYVELCGRGVRETIKALSSGDRGV